MDQLTNSELKQVAAWGLEDAEGLMELISPVFDTWGKISKSRSKDFGEWVVNYKLATGGWSGCEEIVSQLSKSLFWQAYWYSTTRGGLYIFRVGKKKEEKRKDV